MNKQIAWHYTVHTHLRSILHDGVIRQATLYVPIGETPVVWFSTNTVWERTANKAVEYPDGSTRLLDHVQTRERFGWCRFGLPVERLLPYAELGRAGHISRRMRKGLEAVARECGANPAQWYGSLCAVSIYDCTLDIYKEDRWQNVEEAVPLPSSRVG